MLALKNILASADQIPTLIFDEIDQGIGDAWGWWSDSNSGTSDATIRSFAWTHLPQLAVFGDEHYQVQKLIQGNRTLTRVERFAGRAAVARALADARRGRRRDVALRS